MNLSEDLREVLIRAYDLAKKNRDQYITPEHILYAALLNNKVSEAITELGGDIDLLKQEVIKFINENIDESERTRPEESYSFQQMFLFADAQCKSSGKTIIQMHHIFSAMYGLKDSYAVYFLDKQNIKKAELIYKLYHNMGESEDNANNKEASNSQANEYKTIIDKYTVNLSEFVKKQTEETLIGRDDVINRTIQILSRKNKNNPIHIGEPGVGKTAICHGLVKLINSSDVPEKLKEATVFSLEMGSLLAGTKYRGDFEERIKKVLDAIKRTKNPIVYIDEIHTIVGAGALNSSAVDASNLLKPYLMEGKIKFIGATTYDEYKKHFLKDKALSRRFQSVEIKEPSIEETISILKGIKESFESYHNVKYTDESIKNAVNLSVKYINDKHLPDKAIDIIDEAGAFVRMNSKNEDALVVDHIIIDEIISKMCNIPKSTVEKNEISSLKTLDKLLKSKVFGQDTAIDEIVKMIKMSRAGLNNEEKPVASFLFVGPTGVGKTEIAKELAKNLNIDFIRFDMSEYGEKHAASKLIGAPAGYVGYEDGGLLTDSIKKKPHCVLLLDEIEKANVDILNVLLQVMDYATLTDNQGRKADFKNVIIIMTSNAGAKNVGKTLMGFGEREVKDEAIIEEVNKILTPEFRNRLDKIVVFNSLSEEMAYNIAKKQLNLLKEKVASKNIELHFDDRCIEYVAKNGISKEYGAREILRLINNDIKPMLIDEILFGDLSNGGVCNITFEDNKLKIK